MFLRVSEHLWRGPQPQLPQLERLRGQGLKSVFNLRDESVESRALALACGLRYHHLRVRDWDWPSPEQVEEFLELLMSPGWAPALVHCQAGVGRTGIFVSCYRIRYQAWDCEAALRRTDEEAAWASLSQPQRDWVRRWAAQFGSGSTRHQREPGSTQ